VANAAPPAPSLSSILMSHQRLYNRGARLILRLEFGKMTAYEVGPESLPAITQN
jgi:hypothetical protein